jgi:hypothetical protein
MFRKTVMILAALVILMPATTEAQQRPQQPSGQAPTGPGQQQPAPAPAPPGPYKVVEVKPPPALNDPGLDALRQRIAEIAGRKDRAALARLIAAKGFFWDTEDGDKTDKRKPAIDSLARALGLAAQDGSGWEVLASLAADSTASPDPNHPGAVCSPADLVFDQNEAGALVDATKTDPSEWGFPIDAGAEVRAEPKPDAAVVERLGMHLIRVLYDETVSSDQAPDFVRVVTPSGKTGYVASDALAPLGSDQLCYVKEPGGWKIAGYVGEGAE